MVAEQINTDVKVKDPFDINLDCIHCGFCLPRCPTYQVLGDENDSPRGRIYLMKSLQSGRIPLDETVIRHLDCCLGCRACETACPSGVRYEVMLNETRARIYEEQPPTLLQRFVFRRLLPASGLLRQAGRALRFLPASWTAAAGSQGYFSIAAVSRTLCIREETPPDPSLEAIRSLLFCLRELSLPGRLSHRLHHAPDFSPSSSRQY